jgi:hypothetical protein
MVENNNDKYTTTDCIEKLHFVAAHFNYMQGALSVIGDDGPTPCSTDELRKIDRSIADQVYDKLGDLANIIDDVIALLSPSPSPRSPAETVTQHRRRKFRILPGGGPGARS